MPGGLTGRRQPMPAGAPPPGREPPCCSPCVRSSGPGPERRARGVPTAALPVAGAAGVAIPGGLGYLGTRKPILRVDGEGPLRRRRIRPFRMDAAAVTNARFGQFVAATGYRTEAEILGDSFVFAGQLGPDAPATRRVADAPWWCLVEGADWRRPHGPGSEKACRPDHPVVHVTWKDAKAFAGWAGGRLPTEGEWEHAARGGLGDVRFPWGDRDPDERDFLPCNIWQGTFPGRNLGLDGYLATAPALSFPANGYGLHNMVGNVWEWTSQPLRLRSRKRDARRAQAGSSGFRLIKGGSFLCHASYCFRYRIAARSGTSPDSSTSHQGFRLVYDRP